MKYWAGTYFVIGFKWLFSHKVDETGIFARDEARLVAQVNHKKGIDFHISCLEAFQMLLAFSYLNFKLFQMDVNCIFIWLNKRRSL